MNSSRNLIIQYRIKEYFRLHPFTSTKQSTVRFVIQEDLSTKKLLQVLDNEIEVIETNRPTPFWDHRKALTSQKLWLPPKDLDYHSVLSDTFPNDSFMGKSWFYIERTIPASKTTEFSTNDFARIESYKYERKLPKVNKKKPPKVGDKIKEPKPMKTLKMRVFPSEEDQSRLQEMFNQYRWYYNVTVEIHRMGGFGKNFSNISVRNALRSYDFIDGKLEYVPDRNEFPVPPWWNHVYDRVIRGAIKKFVMSLKSAISNYKDSKRPFMMHFLSKKELTYLVHFEDFHFPAFLKEMKSQYWYRDASGRRKMTYRQIESERGLEVIHETDTKKYYFLVPVEEDWYPREDRRRENQARSTSKRTIALDPGVRKFLVGYNPDGEIVVCGRGAHKKLKEDLLLIDTIKDSSERNKKWRKVKNRISEMHWKTAHFLTTNYETILLPDFRISNMVKGKKISKMTKRLLTMFSFHSFKEKLIFKTIQRRKELLIVNESYTSCTCTSCGRIKRLKGAEEYNCRCGISIDRDVNGARNIFLRNLQVRLPF